MSTGKDVMRHHLDDESLTRLVGSNGGSADETQQQHLDGCPACQARVRDLRTVRHTLSALGNPAVPSGLAAGIADRLRTTPEPAPHAERAQHAVAGRSVLPPAVRTRLAHLGPRHLGLAAAVAVGAGGISIAVVGGGGASSALPSLNGPPSAYVAAATEAADTSRSRPRTSSANFVLGMATGSNAPWMRLTGNDYHHTTLGDGVNALFRSPAGGASDANATTPPRPTTASSPAGSFEISRVSAGSAEAAIVPSAACLHAVGGQIDHTPAAIWTVVGIEIARFDGRPATMLALVSGGPAQVQVALAIDGTCTDSNPLVLDQAVVSP